MVKKQEILLESGTNELELLTFLLRDQLFGVNVAKVQSIIQYDTSLVTKTPNAPNAMLGMLLYRDQTIPLIDLSAALDLAVSDSSAEKIVIVTEFNNSTSGYRVDGVDRIHRLSWDDFVPLDSILISSEASIIGSTYIGGKEILVIDMEYILSKIIPGLALEKATTEKIDMAENLKREDVCVYFAEDSTIIRKNVIKILNSIGYTNIQSFENGQRAYESLQRIREFSEKTDNRIDQPHAVVSDIEMPMMDGLTLCRKIKIELGMDQIPVIMFSSLINEQMIAKCESVGADGYVTKPETNKLIDMLDEMCL